MTNESPQDRPLIFVTDFGADTAKGRMKVALEEQRRKLRHGPARILDEIHNVQQFSVLNGSWEVGEATAWKTVESPVIVAVVDPGVGTDRLPIALETEEGIIGIGPNNGIWTHLLEQCRIRTVVCLSDEHRRIPKAKSSTFDGRDHFAWQAGRVSCGVPIEALGDAIDPKEVVTLDIPDGTIQHIDRYGNGKLRDIVLPGRKSLQDLFVSAPSDFDEQGTVHLQRRQSKRLIRRRKCDTYRVRFSHTFGEGEGDVILYNGSSGTPEIAVVLGNARKQLRFRVGDQVLIHRLPPSFQEALFRESGLALFPPSDNEQVSRKHAHSPDTNLDLSAVIESIQ